MTTRLPYEWHPLQRPGNHRLDRPLGGGTWQVPAVVELCTFGVQCVREDGTGVTAREPCIVWRTFRGTGRALRPTGEPRNVSAPPRLLEHFLRLDAASDAQILAYARRWGVLALCADHRQPVSHRPPLYGYVRDPACTGCQPLRFARWEGVERIVEWRSFVQRARGLLHVAAAMHHQRTARAVDWRAAFQGWRETGHGLDGTPFAVPWWRQTPSADRRVFEDLVNFWLLTGGVRPRFAWGGDAPKVVVDSGGLIGALAIQLLLAISRTDGLAVCSGCGLSYIPTKRPAADRRRYCPTCRQHGLPLRDAQRALRARRRPDAGLKRDRL